jgi:hypothetical protein
MLSPYSLDWRSGNRKDCTKWFSKGPVQAIGAGRETLPGNIEAADASEWEVAEEGVGTSPSAVGVDVKASSLSFGTTTGPWIGISQYTRPCGFLAMYRDKSG